MRKSATISILTLLASVAAALVLGVPSQPAAAAGAPAMLQVIQSGGGSVRVQGPGIDKNCTEPFYTETPCMYGGFAQGDVVTLTASSQGEKAFAGWSDERCQAGPVCSLALADDQTVVAQFTPASITVNTDGDGNGDGDEAGVIDETVTITDAAGHTCTASGGDGDRCSGSYPLFERLTLVATGNQARFNPDDCYVTQERAGSATCVLILRGAQRVNVGFNGTTPAEGIPTRVTVLVRGRRSGNGSGTIRGALDCGSRCSVRARFQTPVTLVADADSGSRFVRWTGGCGTAATCSVPAVPGARLTAEFAAATRATPPPPPAKREYSARVKQVSVSGRGGKRRIAVRVRVNRRSTVTATVRKGGRRKAGTSATVPAGTTTVRIPARRLRKGSYTLTVAFRAGSARKSATRSVTVKR